MGRRKGVLEQILADSAGKTRSPDEVEQPIVEVCKPPPQKPKTSFHAIVHGRDQVQQNLANLRNGLKKYKDRKTQFRRLIRLHEIYEEDPIGNEKPDYNHAALIEGVDEIDESIKRIEGVIKMEEKKVEEFDLHLKEHEDYQNWLEQQVKAKAG